MESPLKSENDTVTEENPYAYLDRDFSSENFKIEVKNMPKYYGISEFRKLLNEKLKLNSNKIKTTKRNSSFAFVCFRNTEDRDNAMQVLSKYKWKGKELQVTKAKPAPDPLVKKRKEDSEEHQAKKQKLEGSQEERLKNSTIPYWNVPYEEQLEMKQTNIKNLLKRLGNALAHNNPDLQKWIQNQKSLYNGLPCSLSDIRYSNENIGYRNKCEFTVGIDEETNLSTVGFRIGSYVNGTTGVGPVDGLVHIPESMKVAVKVFQNFVRSSDLSVFNPELHTGHFRQLMARSAPNQLMLVVGIHPQDLDEEKLNKFKQDLVEFFSKGDGKDANVTSLYYQKIVKKNHNNDITPSEHLWGETHIYETILGLKFKISPEAFFQVNSKGAEVLYQSAMELSEPLEDSTVLDVCCGTGTIGLCFSKKCKQVLGIEIIPQAIDDAKENAAINKIENSEFFVGKAEDTLGNVCYKSTGKDVVAVLDPPRAGLHKHGILHIRKIPKIQKVVYVSCNPNAAFENFVDFGRSESKKVLGDPLVPTRAVAVDLFPYTKHCELVISFERWSKLKEQFMKENAEKELQDKEQTDEADMVQSNHEELQNREQIGEAETVQSNHEENQSNEEQHPVEQKI
uniref:tRNA (uracil(54)-C(5))-methyltransferase n=1 Tax=Diabrotica virgifera virgifera TaxID=50390 RepID=A0A6P7GQ24_DIAVI